MSRPVFFLTNLLDNGADQLIEVFEQMEGSQDASISSAAQSYKCIWKVAWRNVEGAKAALLGYTRAIPTGGGNGFFSRVLPHAHPKAPWLFCTEIVRTEGRVPRGRDDAGVASYQWAFLYCVYTKQNCAILPDDDPEVAPAGNPDESRLARFVRIRRRSAIQYMTSRVGGWTWLDRPVGHPNRFVAMEIPWRMPRLRLILTWKNIPLESLNQGYINSCIGTTNSDTIGQGLGEVIAGLGVGITPETALLNGADWPDLNPIPGQDGLQTDVTFEIICYGSQNNLVQFGPNFFPDYVRGNTWHEIGFNADVGATVSPFPKRAWKPMFQPVF